VAESQCGMPTGTWAIQLKLTAARRQFSQLQSSHWQSLSCRQAYTGPLPFFFHPSFYSFLLAFSSSNFFRRSTPCLIAQHPSILITTIRPGGTMATSRKVTPQPPFGRLPPTTVIHIIAELVTTTAALQLGPARIQFSIMS